MKITVLITFLRQTDFLLEAVESVLSQRTWPHQVILAGSAHAESTVELAEMYEQEVDEFLVYGGGNPTHGALRRQTLPHITGDAVLPLNAGHCLYTGTIDRFREAGSQPVTLGSYLRIAADGSEAQLPDRAPETFADHLRLGPVPSGCLLVRTDWLRERDDWFWQRAEGPLFSFAVLEQARTEGSLGFVPEPVLECWSYDEGPVCWLPSVWEALGTWLREPDRRSDLCPVLRSMLETGGPDVAGRLLDRFCDREEGDGESTRTTWSQPPRPPLE